MQEGDAQVCDLDEQMNESNWQTKLSNAKPNCVFLTDDQS